MTTTGERERTKGGGLQRARDRERKPTNTTQRQLAQQVAQGRRVTFIPPLAEPDEHITGYIGGWDSPEIGPMANYLVFVPTTEVDDRGEYVVEQHLIPQTGTRIQMHSESTFEGEAAFPVLDRMSNKFKNYVIHSVLAPRRGQSDAESS